MKKVLIADITTLTYEDKLFGHFAKVANQYCQILSKEFDVQIAGGKTYKNYFRDYQLYQLPFFIKKNENASGIAGRIKRKWKEFFNAWKCLHSNSDIIIFQCLNETPVYLALLFGCNKKVYMIQYQRGLDCKGKKVLYDRIKNRISGTIVSSDIVGKYYDITYIVLPDYFPPVQISSVQDENLIYDITILGTANTWKDYVGAVKYFRNSRWKMLIAGKFTDESMYNAIMQLKTDNITVINKYLTDIEYQNCLNCSKYIMLPYKEEYKDKSSGVLLEAIYAGKPVIVPDISTFDIVNKNKLGIVYKNLSDLKINMKKLQDEYEDYKKNVQAYTDNMRIKSDELIEFVKVE
jgi:glycosyltransferase involved in cell wall biosynthesis